MEFAEHVNMAFNSKINVLKFLLLVIGYTCTYYKHSKDKTAQYVVAIVQFLYNYVSMHYTPTQLPKLYAIITSRIPCGKILYQHRLALKYLDIYHKQSKQNKLHELSISYDQYFPEEQCIYGSILSQLALYYLYRNKLRPRIDDKLANFKDGIKFQNNACKFFIDNHQNYSVYSSIDPLYFVMDFIQILVTHDYNQIINPDNKYQKIYKKTIKNLIKRYSKSSFYLHEITQCRLTLIKSLFYMHCHYGDPAKNLYKSIKALPKAITNGHGFKQPHHHCVFHPRLYCDFKMFKYLLIVFRASFCVLPYNSPLIPEDGSFHDILHDIEEHMIKKETWQELEKVEAVVPHGITLKVIDNSGKLPVTLEL